MKINPIEYYRMRYPEGIIVELEEPIIDTYGNNKPAGARFKVSFIDDMGSMHGNWLAPQSGTLAIIIEHDKFKIVFDEEG